MYYVPLNMIVITLTKVAINQLACLIFIIQVKVLGITNELVAVFKSSFFSIKWYGYRINSLISFPEFWYTLYSLSS